jgi:CHAT domain-containing protein
METFFSLVAFHMKNNPVAQKDLLDIWLKRKGIILESQKRFQEALIYSDNSESVLRVFQELSRVRIKLSKLNFSQLKTSDLKLFKKKIAEMENQKEMLGAELAKVSQSYSIQRNRERANSTQVAAALPDKTVLLEIAKIHQYNFKAIKNENNWLQANYFVFVLHAGQADRVALIDLGPADIIDSEIQELKYQIKAGQELKASKKLYEMVFAKIKPKLDSSKEIFISPDGNLNLIAFEILQNQNGRFLIEDYTFNYLSAGRDIVGFGKQKGNSQKSLLIGDPDFDLRVHAINLQGQDMGKSLPQLTSRKRSAEMKKFHFRRLPGTLKEVQSIKQILGQNETEIKTGAEAVEQVLFQMKSPKILHIATHGFFLNDKNLPALSNDRGTFIPKPLKGMVNIENPLVRSGLALAGANNTLNLKNVEESQGLLTAEKVLGLNLTDTELVVLSACDTGLGEVQTGEGVYGLRRAFVQAGAKSLVMSMWKVPDTETRELMVQFYKNIKSGMNRCQALRQAALHERKIIKKRYKKDKPSYWGAFLFLGES